MEILSPSGNLDSLKAAINGGANAIYLGLSMFSARKSAKNFDLDELKEALRIAHTLDVKIYVAVNTLIKDEEFSDLVKLLDEAYLLGVDSFIVQDYGLINLISKRYPDISLHISTQVNITNPFEAIHFKEIGSDRVVLARELSYAQIERIKKEAQIELEVFVHGAICVSYSGNCYFSKSIGPRSGNRGDCAQVCRKKFSLVKEDEVLDNDYLISPKDMSNIDDLAKFEKAGVDSLKIEGRLKSAAYTYYVTKACKDKLERNINPNIETLKKLYNRDFTHGFIDGETNIVNKKTNNHLGILIGKVVKANPRFVTIKLKGDLNISDGIRIKSKQDYGFTVTSMFKDKKHLASAKKGDIVDIPNDHYNVKQEDLVYLTKDYNLENVSTNVTRKRVIKAKFRANIGFMSLSYNDIKVTSTEVEWALNHANTAEEIDKQLTKTGKTMYELQISYELNDLLFINNKALTKLKLAFIEKLDEKFLTVNRKLGTYTAPVITDFDSHDTYYVTCETKEQYEALKNYDVKIIIRNEKLYNELNNKDLYLFSDRINLDRENYHQKLMISDYTYLNTDNEMIGSNYLNVYNTISAKEFLARGLKTVFLSHDLDLEEILKINPKGLNLGVNIYGKIDVMIMKTCPIRNHYNTPVGCGLCHKNNYYLADQYNNKYLLKEENHCNLRIMDYKEINLIKQIDILKEFNYHHFLINFTTESKDKVSEIMNSIL